MPAMVYYRKFRGKDELVKKTLKKLPFDLRQIDSQEALLYLFEQTSFFQHKDYAFGDKGAAIKIAPPQVWDGEPYQHVYIGECEYMGNVTVADLENSGHDALFIQTLVQLFKDGKLRMVENEVE